MTVVICLLDYSSCLYFVSYSPGDVVMVAPKNMRDTVDDFIKFFNLKPDQTLVLQENDQGIVRSLSSPFLRIVKLRNNPYILTSLSF